MPKRRRQRRQRTNKVYAKKGSGLRGLVGTAVPNYGNVLHPFHIKFERPLPRFNSPSVIQPMRQRSAIKMNYTSPNVGGVDVNIKGKPIALYSKGRKVVKR